MGEHPKSKSTQPRGTTTWDALYQMLIISYSSSETHPMVAKGAKDKSGANKRPMGRPKGKDKGKK